MADRISISQHLEMMLNKRSRCEDWVASIASNKKSLPSVESSENNDPADFVDDDFSDVANSCEGSKRHTRKSIQHQHTQLQLLCEWNKCNFNTTGSKNTFVQHVIYHIKDLSVVEQEKGTPCYQCLWQHCGHLSSDSSEMKRHLSLHSFHSILKANGAELQKKWEIEECNRSSNNRNSVPNATSAFQCRVNTCEFMTDNFCEFFTHVEQHVNSLTFDGQQEIKCIWKECSMFKCKKKSLMKIHVRSHTGEKLLACSNCGAMFATNTKFMDHCARKSIIQDESNQCQFCLRYYPNERLLRDHMRYHVNSHKCSFCEMTFSTPAVLVNHVRQKHLNTRLFHCTICPFKTMKAYDFNCHLTIHEKEPQYKCRIENCNFSCRSVIGFKKHYLSVHLNENGPVYKCHLCDKEFNRGTFLGTHLRKVHKLERLPGHPRFRYMENKDGYYRVQVERYESLEISNAKSSIVSIPGDTDCNIVVSKENNNGADSFRVCVQSLDEQKKSENTVITIDELDEKGNLIRSSTVTEELSLDQLPENVLMVKVTDDLPDSSDSPNESSENTKSNDINTSSNSHSKENLYDEQPLRIRRKRRKLNLSDNLVNSIPDLIIRRD